MCRDLGLFCFHLLYWMLSGPFHSVNSYALVSGRFLEVFYWWFLPLCFLFLELLLFRCWTCWTVPPTFLSFLFSILLSFYFPFWQYYQLYLLTLPLSFFISAIMFLISRVCFHFLVCSFFRVNISYSLFCGCSIIVSLCNISKESVCDNFFIPA